MESLPVIWGDRKIRRIQHEDAWWFAVEDICGALMESPDGVECWQQLRQRLESEGCEVGTLCHGLELPAPDGTARRTDCVTLEGVFRLVQSIALPRAEVFKRWLAKAGREEKRLQGYRTDTDSIFALLYETVAGRIANRRKG